MKKTIAVSALAVMVFLLVGCRGDSSLTGCKWTYTEDGITLARQFNDDGTVSEWFNNIRMDGVYTINGNEISTTMTAVTNENSGEETRELPESLIITSRWLYSLDGDELTLVNLEYAGEEDAAAVYIRE